MQDLFNEKEPHRDIKSLPARGSLIFPLSMGLLPNSLSPESIYEFLEFFENKFTHKSIDIILLYTNDLYLNSDEEALYLRNKLLNQMLQHKRALESLILKKRHFPPDIFHYLPWDYVLLNTPDFNSERARLLKHLKLDPVFNKALEYDLAALKQPATESAFQFLIEEVVASHLITEKEVLLPHRLGTADSWRLLCYPGNPLLSMIYVWQKNLLGKRKDFPKHHLMLSRSFYNMKSKILIDFERVDLKALFS